MAKSVFINQLGGVDLLNPCFTINPSFVVTQDPVTGEVCMSISNTGAATTCAGTAANNVQQGDNVCTPGTFTTFEPSFVYSLSFLFLVSGANGPVISSNAFIPNPQFFPCGNPPIDFSTISYQTPVQNQTSLIPPTGQCGSMLVQHVLGNGCQANVYFYFNENNSLTTSQVEYVGCLENLYFEAKCPNGDKIDYEIVFEKSNTSGSTYTVNWTKDEGGNTTTGSALIREGVLFGTLPSIECCEEAEDFDIGVLLAKNDIAVRICSEKFLTAQDYKGVAVLKVETAKNSGVFEELVRQRLKLDQNGCDTWNIERIVRGCLKCEFPDFASQEIFEHDKSARRFKLCFEETCTIDGEQQTEVCEIGAFTAINGGINLKHLGFQSFKDQYLNGQLTWQPKKQTITSHQHNYVTWFNGDGYNAVQWTYVLKNPDGSILEFDTYPALIAESNCLYSFPASICNLPIDADIEDGQELCVALLDTAGNKIFEIVYCIVCHENHYNYMLFCNSLGGIDSMYFTGKKNSISDFEGSFSKATKKLKKGNQRFLCKVVQDTGRVLDNCKMWFLNEFFNAKAIKQINFAVDNPLEEDCDCSCTDCKKGWYCDVVIAPGEFSTTVDFEYDPLRQFTYYEVEKKEVFTPAFCSPDTIVDPCENVIVALAFEVVQFANGFISVTAIAGGMTGTIQYSLDNGATYITGSSISFPPDENGKEVRFVMTTPCGNVGYYLDVVDAENYKVYNLFNNQVILCVPENDNPPQ